LNRTRLGVILIAVLVSLGWAATAFGSHDAQVVMKDDCDAATFNAAIGPGTCVGNGRTTFADFVAQLQANGVQANRSAKGWAFKPGKLEVDQGEMVTALNKGGETHSFTEVAQYGGGCVAILNTLLGGLTPVPECANPADFPGTLVPAGGARTVSGLSAGIHHFECLIHPWMRTDVVVENENEDDD
jgi:plastocyanin